MAMVVFAFSCFGLLLFLWLSFGGAIPLKPKGYRFEIAFQEATQLAPEADVRTAGVSIGKVRTKRVDTDGNRTIATIELERKYAPIASDARAQLRQKTLLGETFVELTMGSQGAPPLPEGGRLDQSKVQASVELDEILDSLDPYTQKAFRTWQRDQGDAVQGRGRDLNDAFGNLPGFVEEGGDLFEVLDEQKQALQQLVKGTGVVFGALTKSERQLETLITSQDQVFSAIADEQEAFAETWRIFPTFLDESKLTFTRLESFSKKAEPVVRDLEPAFRDLDPTLRDLGTLAPDLRRYFRNFDPLITISNTSQPATREVLAGLKPLLNEVPPFLGQINPIIRYIGIHTYTLSDMFANLGVATAAKVAQPGTDQMGHYLRQFGPVGPESFAAQPNRVATNRGNAYLNPLGVINSPDAQKFKILPAHDCNNAGGEKEPGGTPTQTPGCRIEKPFTFKTTPEQYPRITEDNYYAK
jgi:virulence factor Mce-like protein